MMDRCFKETGGVVMEWEGLIEGTDDVTIPDGILPKPPKKTDDKPK